jgi:prepilin-type N-terminal cleavage/methylation domain-containing protein
MSKSSTSTRNAFTLIELLVVISVIGFMSGMFLVAYRGAAQEATIQKTRATIQKINEVLISRMEEYASFPIALQNINAPGGAIPGGATAMGSASDYESPTLLLERARLLSLRDIISMEMPDHPDDLKWSQKWSGSANSANPAYWNGLTRPLATGLLVGGSPVIVKNKPTARVRGLVRRLSLGTVPIPGWETAFANAELLFLIVEDSDLNGTSAIELFGKSEIGDKDGDGLNEFLDGFGNPIQWIRWPSGYEGVARYHPDMLGPDILVGSSPNVRVSISSDPLDRVGADPGLSRHFQSGSVASWEPFKPGPGAFPLVVSAGQDEIFGLRFQLTDADAMAIGSYSVRDARWLGGQPNYPAVPFFFTDPWYPRRNVGPAPERLGGRLSPTDNSSLDNISNYDGNGA